MEEKEDGGRGWAPAGGVLGASPREWLCFVLLTGEEVGWLLGWLEEELEVEEEKDEEGGGCTCHAWP